MLKVEHFWKCKIYTWNVPLRFLHTCKYATGWEGGGQHRRLPRAANTLAPPLSLNTVQHHLCDTHTHCLITITKVVNSNKHGYPMSTKSRLPPPADFWVLYGLYIRSSVSELFRDIETWELMLICSCNSRLCSVLPHRRDECRQHNVPDVPATVPAGVQSVHGTIHQVSSDGEAHPEHHRVSHVQHVLVHSSWTLWEG